MEAKILLEMHKLYFELRSHLLGLARLGTRPELRSKQ